MFSGRALHQGERHWITLLSSWSAVPSPQAKRINSQLIFERRWLHGVDADKGPYFILFKLAQNACSRVPLLPTESTLCPKCTPTFPLKKLIYRTVHRRSKPHTHTKRLFVLLMLKFGDRSSAFMVDYGTFLSAAGYIVIDSRYRGRGVMQSLIGLIEEKVCSLGYPAFLARMAISARNVMPNVTTGTQLLGVVPKSLKVG